MKGENQSPKIIAAAVTLLLVGTVIYLAMQIRANKGMESDLKSEKLKSEAMLSEKLSLEKELVKFKDEIKALYGRNQELDKVLAATAEKLDAKSADLKKVQNQNASLVKFKKQYEELAALRKELEQKLEYYATSYKDLQEKNENLNQTVALLQQKNKNLTEEIKAIRIASFNDVRVESHKRNNRLTVNAKKTKKLLVNIDVPAYADNLLFRITDPTGKELTQKDGTITSSVKGDYQNQYTASTNGSPLMPAYKEVEMVYTPVRKLAPGIYKIEVMNGDISLGSLQVRFR